MIFSLKKINNEIKSKKIYAKYNKLFFNNIYDKTINIFIYYKKLRT